MRGILKVIIRVFRKTKDLFSNYCVISKRIIDSFDDKITDSQKMIF